MIIIFQESKRCSAMSCGNDTFESMLASDNDIEQFTGQSALSGLEWLDVYFVSYRQWSVTPTFQAFFRRNDDAT